MGRAPYATRSPGRPAPQARPPRGRRPPGPPAAAHLRARAALADERRTIVFFEAPHRLADSLADLAEAFGADRRAAVCRELTKTYEEVKRGTLAELAHWASGEVRGEITLVVAGAL